MAMLAAKAIYKKERRRKMSTKLLVVIMSVGGRVISNFELRCWAACPSQSDRQSHHGLTRLPLVSIDNHSIHPHSPSSYTNSRTRAGQWQGYYDMGFFSRKADDSASATTTITTTLPVSHSAAGDRSMVQVLRSRFVRAFVVLVMGPC